MSLASPPSQPLQRGGGDLDLSKSIVETDQLLTLFRESFAQLSDTQSARLNHMGFNQSGASFRGSGGNSVLGTVQEDSAEVSQILERYSDRLMELVSDKIAAKFSK